jgi:hypothetical protein
VVVVGQPLALVEHVLLEDAAVVAGDGDRADVVEAPDVVAVGEVDRVARALYVRALGGQLVGLDVVDGREVEEVVDPRVARQGRVVDAERRLREVARDRDDPALGGVQPPRQLVDLAARSVAGEDVDRPVVLQQLLDEVPPDESRRPCDEVVHAGASLTACYGCSVRRVRERRATYSERGRGAGGRVARDAAALGAGRVDPAA